MPLNILFLLMHDANARSVTKGSYSEVTANPMHFDILLLLTLLFGMCVTFVCKTGAMYQHLTALLLKRLKHIYGDICIDECQ